MNATANHWAIVLAAGDGTRLHGLTTSPDGTAVPKQFCSLFGARSLLEDAIARANQIIPAEHICTIVAHQHRRWWLQNKGAGALPPSNVFVQPQNRGTAIGVLYSLLHVLNKDPEALVLLLPADHYVDVESTLMRALRSAMDLLERNAERAVLLGMEPDRPDSEFGYILPGDVDPRGGQIVARFIEKPPVSVAREIMAQGGLSNTFIIAAAARTLVDLFMPRFAAIVVEMQLLLSRYFSAPHADWMPLVDFYGRLPQLDFSRDILEDQNAQLCVLRVPACGWNDLGTPGRVGETLRRVSGSNTTASEPCRGYLNLASQYQRLEVSRKLAIQNHVYSR